MVKVFHEEVPFGPYCYDLKEIVDNGESEPPTIKIRPCPFWELRKNRPSQENGYCHFMECGDWDDAGASLLWDGVKECGINTDEEEKA